MKTNVTLSLDVEVVTQARNKFENLSGEVEKLLKKELCWLENE